jgi:hypothetical protein
MTKNKITTQEDLLSLLKDEKIDFQFDAGSPAKVDPAFLKSLRTKITAAFEKN